MWPIRSSSSRSRSSLSRSSSYGDAYARGGTVPKVGPRRSAGEDEDPCRDGFGHPLARVRACLAIAAGIGVTPFAAVGSLAALRSIDGVERLPELRTFGLTGRTTGTIDFDPLLRCAKLRKVALPTDRMKNEVAAIRKALWKRSVRVVAYLSERDHEPLSWRTPP
jgi:hypothetical protein